MDDNQDSRGFTLPKSFLTQLGEYTRGYMLLVCNEKGELYAHEAYDNAVIKLGIINFAELHVAAIQKHMENIALKEEESWDIEDGEDNDKED